jgi:hypothetical protein
MVANGWGVRSQTAGEYETALGDHGGLPPWSTLFRKRKPVIDAAIRGVSPRRTVCVGVPYRARSGDFMVLGLTSGRVSMNAFNSLNRTQEGLLKL